jgi:spore maturation protein CgeB
LRARSILYVGPLSGTCLQRAHALRSLGHRVEQVEAGVPELGWRRQLYRVGHHLRRPPDVYGSNRLILSTLRGHRFDLLWVDKGLTIRARTLRRARALQPSLVIVSYSPDDMAHPDNTSAIWEKCLPLYDLHVTTKSFNVAELPALGARGVFYVDNAFDPETHRPLDLSDADRRRFAADVGFVGTYERGRADAMLELARRGVRVTVYGGRWERYLGRHPNLALRREVLSGLDYARAVNATRINLGFLRAAYRDLQTTRSIEIPACGGFLLAERTQEHQRLFEEGVEAEFFASFGEMEEKIRHYLEHEDERLRIAAAGRRRCLESGYSNQSRLAKVIEHLEPRLPASL